MSEIVINSCKHTSNVDALEAVLKFMGMNCRCAKYKRDRTVVCHSGRRVKVREENYGTVDAPCDGKFTVTLIEKKVT